MKTTKLIQDKLIEQFKLLEHPSTSTKLFGDVQKIYMAEPTTLPSCEILAKSTSFESETDANNSRIIQFDAVTYDLIETVNNSQSQANTRVDRMQNIADHVSDYLLAIPFPIENSIAGLHCWKCEIDSITYDYVSGHQGIMLYSIIRFNIFVLQNVK